MLYKALKSDDLVNFRDGLASKATVWSSTFGVERVSQQRCLPASQMLTPKGTKEAATLK
jgi:hypothetical protein